MKRNIIFSGLLLCAMALLPACGGDDDPEKVDFINQDVAGTYDGTFNVTMGGLPVAQDIQKDIVIAKATDSSVDLTLNEFSLNIAGAEIPVGTIKVSNCTVTQGSGSYAIKGSETLMLAVGSCPTEVEGTVKDGNLSLTINVTTSVPIPDTKVVVTYTGKKK